MVEQSGNWSTAGIVRPQDCAIAFGIPTCRAGFSRKRSFRGNSNSGGYVLENSRDDLDSGDYVLKFSSWDEYRASFVCILDQVLPALCSAGVSLIHNATMSSLSEAFRNHRVVVLFSHWKDGGDDFPQGAVEMADGFRGVNAIVETVPIEYDGLLDLCVCHPDTMPGALHRARPRCRVKCLQGKATPTYWLLFYQALFERLRVSPMSYLDALVRTQAEVISEGHHRKATA